MADLRNRKERRAAARQSGQPVPPPTATPHLKLAQPDRTPPVPGKTLLDLYEAKKAALAAAGESSTSKSDTSPPMTMDSHGNILEAGLGGPDDEFLGPLGQSVFWSTALAMLHFTLDVLVSNQYRQDIDFPSITRRSLLMWPVLSALMYLLRARSSSGSLLRWARQAFFFVLAGATGCYTIHVGNRYDFYAVMQRVPPAGTLWIWSVIELELLPAVASVGVDLAFMWWKGYSAF
ncbi:hypothetical protein M433DRAFT_142868 [Acidomyces richmondensis BFW]|nr:MAG: hypothetical protein FE78DRAFT_78628 [Acidomyces sp. 'richmondensis']KYG46560.1 hypothetical protein M433DRAFT_142868 [Acidomyces richmondensis BFW]